VVLGGGGGGGEGGSRVGALPGVANVEGNIIRMASGDEGQLWSVLQGVHEAGGQIVEVTRPRLTLQDVFVRAIGEEGQ
jgi:hypothetical protein